MVLALQAFQETARIRNHIGLPLRDPGGSKLRRGRWLGLKIQNWGSPNSSVAEQEHEHQLKFNFHNLELIGYLPDKIKLLFKKIKTTWRVETDDLILVQFNNYHIISLNRLPRWYFTLSDIIFQFPLSASPFK